MKDLTPQEITILKDSWKEMAPRIHEMTSYFYNNLHAIDPSLVPSFSDQQELYKQADKALYCIGFLIASLDNLIVADAGIKKIFKDFRASHKRIKFSDSTKLIQAFILSAKTTFKENWTNRQTICWYRLTTILLEILNNGKVDIKLQLVQI
ncbi:MAG: hypothetical protein ABJF11_16150 [Reichenbachiella sp.]|uniref:hypothetical protein n=1 Tax=Reichenbachiella sp. TaxID=2184521 RepID=UPI0032653515